MAKVYEKHNGVGVYSSNVPYLRTTGSFYEVGYDIGKTFSDRIKGYWNESELVKQKLIPYAATDNGREYIESSLGICKSAFPQYIQQLQGISDGSGLPFEDCFLLCLRAEIKSVLYPKELDTSLGCTDVYINNPKCKLIAHNEDCYHIIDKFGYIISVTIVENNQEIENFTSYCYPCSLGGATTSFNSHGMVFTCNALYPDYLVPNAPPREFLSRSIITAKNIEEAIGLAKNTGFGMGFAFNVNIADVKNPSTMWTVEIGPQAGESKVEVQTLDEEPDESKPCHYFHVNCMELLTDVSEIPNNSSLSRRKRAHEMNPPRTKKDALTILGDTTNQEYPIFRVADKTTVESSTTFTSVCDILENRVEFYHGNPIRQDFKPSFSFQIMEENN